MKVSATLALVVIVGLVASSSALPAKKRMVYFQQPSQYYAGPQRMMYVQYVQPSRPFARSTQAAEALVAGESVATGTYLQDCDHAEADIAAAGPAVDFAAAAERGEDILGEAGAHAVQSVAEAYPAAGEDVPSFAGVPADVDIVAEENEVSNDAAKVPRDFNLDSAAEDVPEVPSVDADELPAPAPIAPVAKPARRYLPAQNKKVYVELDQSVESDEDTGVAIADEAEAAEEEVAQVATVARRPVAKKPAKAAAPAAKPQKPLPAGTFFPIDFGGTSGGAIAIANSFSTGEGGSATSHAIAYGSPDAVRSRTRPSKLH